MQSEFNTWIELREPGCVPEIKGAFKPSQVKGFLIEVMDCRPTAFITVITTYGENSICVEDGPQALEIIDGRYKHKARQHRQTSAAAFAVRAAGQRTRQDT